MKRKTSKANKRLIFVILLAVTLYVIFGPITVAEIIQFIKNIANDIRGIAQKNIP